MHRTLIAAVAMALGLLVVAAALATLPKAGASYKGSTSAAASNGFKPPVSFKVSADGKQLLGFKYSAGDCGGMGGPGSPWVNQAFTRNVGTIPVDARGNFAVKNAKSKGPLQGADASHSKTNVSTVSGHFGAAGVATGTIKLTVTIDGETCPDNFAGTFTARAH